MKNKYAFTNLDNFKLIYRVLKNGELAEEGMVDMPSVTPGSTGTVSLPYKSTAQSGEEMVVNVYLILTMAPYGRTMAMLWPTSSLLFKTATTHSAHTRQAVRSA